MEKRALKCTRPSKEMVRAWLAQRRLRAEAPPEPDEIRKALNWTAKTVQTRGLDGDQSIG